MIGWQPTTTYTRASPATKPDTSAGRRGNSSNASSAICWTTDLRTRISIRKRIRAEALAVRCANSPAPCGCVAPSQQPSLRAPVRDKRGRRIPNSRRICEASRFLIYCRRRARPVAGERTARQSARTAHLHHITAFLRPDCGPPREGSIHAIESGNEPSCLGTTSPTHAHDLYDRSALPVRQLELPHADPLRPRTCIRELAQTCRELGIERPLLVTDPGLARCRW